MKKYKVELTGYKWMLLFISSKVNVLVGDDDARFVTLCKQTRHNALALLHSKDFAPFVLKKSKKEILVYRVALLRACALEAFCLAEKKVVVQILNYLNKLI